MFWLIFEPFSTEIKIACVPTLKILLFIFSKGSIALNNS